MRIDRFSLPLTDPLGTARGTITEREGLVVRLDVDGTVGVGEAAPLPGWTESPADCEAALERTASERADGTPVETALRGMDGTPAARHAVASALLDARARAAGTPLYRPLAEEYGEEHPDPVRTVPVNATVGDGSPTETATAAAEAVDAGHETVKLKVGARSVSDDIERVAAVRERCQSVPLRADANGAWDRETAADALDALAERGIDYVEQPLPADATRDADGRRRDLAGHAALRGGAVGIALDESLATGDGSPVSEALDADAADVLVLKPMALGGPDRAREAAAAARRAGVRPVLTTTIDAAFARATAVHVAASIPDVPACGLATGGRLGSDLLEDDPAPVTGGNVQVPDGPGTAGATRWHDMDADP
jgi:o-succinylbenzoate synthase